METSSQLHAQAVLSTMKFSLFPSNSRLCMFQIQCEQFGGETNFVLLPRIKTSTPPAPQPPAYSVCRPRQTGSHIITHHYYMY